MGMGWGVWAGGKGENEWGVAGWADWDGTRTSIEELAASESSNAYPYP